MSFIYDTLIAAIYAETTEDATTELGQNIDTILALGQRRAQRDLELDVFTDTDEGVLAVGNYQIARPTDMIEAQEMYYSFPADTSRKPLKNRSYAYVRDYWPDPSATATPRYFAEDAMTNIIIAPTPNVQITYYLRYHARLAVLSAANPSNWLSLNQGDLLLFSCLVQCEAFLQEEERGRVSLWEGFYQGQLPKALAEVAGLTRVTGERARAGGTTAPAAENSDGT